MFLDKGYFSSLSESVYDKVQKLASSCAYECTYSIFFFFFPPFFSGSQGGCTLTFINLVFLPNMLEDTNLQSED